MIYVLDRHARVLLRRAHRAVGAQVGIEEQAILPCACRITHYRCLVVPVPWTRAHVTVAIRPPRDHTLRLKHLWCAAVPLCMQVDGQPLLLAAALRIASLVTFVMDTRYKFDASDMLAVMLVNVETKLRHALIVVSLYHSATLDATILLPT